MTYSYPVPPTSIDLEAANSVPLRIAEAQPALPKGLQPFMTLNPLLTEGSVPNGQSRDALDNPYLGDIKAIAEADGDDLHPWLQP